MLDATISQIAVATSVQDRQDIAEDDAALWTISGLQEHGKLVEDGKINIKDPRAKQGVTCQRAINALKTIQYTSC